MARQLSHMMPLTFIQTFLALALFIPALAAGCSPAPASPAAAAAEIPSASLSTPLPIPTASPIPSSPCVPYITPQPTLTPSAHAPTPAFAVSPTSVAVANGKSELRESSFYSSHLDRVMPFLIYLPPGYTDTTRRYPVLYMLSGFAGDRHEWVNWGICNALEQLVRGEYIQPLIVVLPEGDHSWWFNHASVPGSDGKAYGDYIWSDLVHYVDGSFRSIPSRTSRAIGGLSAGGQAALSFGLTHPEVFSIVGAHSPSIRHADGSLAIFGDESYFQQYDPSWLLPNTDTWKQLTLWLDVAKDDTQWGDSVHDLHKLLVALGMSHDFQDGWDGIHDDYYWSAHLPDYLMWYSSKLAGDEMK